jgi:hypothetical protein
MNRSLHPRTFSKVSESTRRRLQAYELAATAAGVGMLALASPSEAEIIYTPAHRIIKVGMNYKLDLNHDGVFDFTLTDFRCRSCGGGAQFSVLPAAGNGASGFATTDQFSGNWASALKGGALIGTRRYFPGRGMAFIGTTGDGQTFRSGSWVNVKNRYLGLKFKINGKTHYGWARLNVSVQNLSVIATLTGYAYETIPGKATIAGKTKGPDDDGQPAPASLKTPPLRPATLGRLALGAPGLSIWRREESVVAAPESN